MVNDLDFKGSEFPVSKNRTLNKKRIFALMCFVMKMT